MAPSYQQGILLVGILAQYMGRRQVPQSQRCTCSLLFLYFLTLNLNFQDMICICYPQSCIDQARKHIYRLRCNIRHNKCYSILNKFVHNYIQHTCLAAHLVEANHRDQVSPRHLDNTQVSKTAFLYLHILWHLAASTCLLRSLCTTKVLYLRSKCHCCKKHSGTKGFSVR